MPRQHNPSRARTVAGKAQEGPRPDVPGEAHEALPKRRTRKQAPSTPALPDPREVGWWEYIRAWDVAQKGWPESNRASIADLTALKHIVFDFMDNAQELSDRIAFVCSMDLYSKDGMHAAQALGDLSSCDESSPLGAFYIYLRKRIEGMEAFLSLQDASQGVTP